MTQSEFIKKYCDIRTGLFGISSKNIEQELNNIGQFAVPCYCGKVGCHGWAMTSMENFRNAINCRQNNENNKC